MQFALLHEVQLILADVIAVELVGRAVEVLGETPDRANVGNCGSLRVVATLEFVERHFSKLGHRDLLVTHTIWQRTWPRPCPTRSVRRASGLVQTAFLETDRLGVVLSRNATSQPLSLAIGFRCIFNSYARRSLFEFGCLV